MQVTAELDRIAALIRSERPRLVLLDLMLPGTGGTALIGEIPELSDLPVIFISGYGRNETIACAFQAVAADYAVKPFSPAELVARVALALRRQSPPAPFRVGEFELARARRRVTLAGQALRLTATEYRLLEALSPDAGGVADYETLIRRVWSGRGDGNVEALRSAMPSSAAGSATTLGSRATSSACAAWDAACPGPTTGREKGWRER